jgi:hypothetical protein
LLIRGGLLFACIAYAPRDSVPRTMPRPQSPLTKLILSLPADMPVADVIVKAKEAGFETNEKNVSRVRVDQKKREAGTTAAAKKPAAKKPAASKKPVARKPAAKPAAANGAPVNKTDFVRSQPASMSAKEIAEKATAAGLEISTEYIYKVRSRLGTKAGKKPAAKPAPASKIIAKPKAATPKPALAPKPVAPPSGSDEVVTFRRLVLSLGVTRSRQLLDELERGLAALIGG